MISVTIVTYVTDMCDVTLHILPKFKIKEIKMKLNKIKEK